MTVQISYVKVLKGDLSFWQFALLKDRHQQQQQQLSQFCWERVVTSRTRSGFGLAVKGGGITAQVADFHLELGTDARQVP